MTASSRSSAFFVWLFFLFVIVISTTTPRLAAASEIDGCIRAADRAQPLRAKGSLIEARAELLVCAAASCPTVVRVDCTKWLSEVEQATPSIVIHVKDEDGRDLVTTNLSAVRLVIDDGRAGVSAPPARALIDGLPIPLNPGSHKIRLDAEGRSSYEETVVLRQAERDRNIIATLRSRSVGGAGSGGTTTTTTKTTKNESDGLASSRKSIPVFSYVIGGVGALALGTGIAFWVVGNGEHGDLESTCARTGTCTHDDVVSARTALIAGDILIGAGIVSLGVAVIGALLWSPASKPTMKQQGRAIKD